MSFKDKLISSLNKVCEENLDLSLVFNLAAEIEDLLVTEDDKNAFYLQMSSQQTPITPKEDEECLAEPSANQTEAREQVQISPELRTQLKNSMLVDAALQMQLQQQNKQSNLFFSIGDTKKICKFLFRIEQCLIKHFFSINQ